MNKMIITSTLLVIFLLVSGALAVQAEEMNRPSKPEGRMKPPPEAIAACKGKGEGTKVQFTTPRGNTLTGICKQFEGTLAAMPEHDGAPPPRNSGITDETKTGR